MIRVLRHASGIIALFGSLGCAGRTYPRPFVGTELVNLAALPACPRRPIDSSAHETVSIPDQAPTRIRVRIRLDRVTMRRPGFTSTRLSGPERRVAVTVERINLNEVVDLPLVWPDMTGPFANTGMACDDCMVTETHCVETIAGAPRFVAIGHMSGWSRGPIAYTTWKLSDRTWQIVSVAGEDADIAEALAILRSVSVGD